MRANIAIYSNSELRYSERPILHMCVCVCVYSRVADYMNNDVKYVITEDQWDDTFDTVGLLCRTFIS